MDIDAYICICNNKEEGIGNEFEGSEGHRKERDGNDSTHAWNS